jgi:Protein of unknown function (DUF3575)
MKCIKCILLFSLSFVFLQNTNAQIAMLKATGILNPINDNRHIGIILDFAVEAKIKGRLTGQLSVSSSKGYYNSAYREKLIVTPQLRYYFKKDSWLKSPYLGLVLQKNVGKADVDDDNNWTDFKYTSFTKYGAGLMIGQHIKVRKNFGIDIHLGFLREKGDNMVRVEEHDPKHVMPKNYTYFEKGAVNNRFFAGFNFYFAIDKS